MLRSRLRNKYYKDKTDASALAYKKQRNKCVSLLRNAKKTYFGNLNPSVICDNKKFWKIVNPLFSEQAVSTNSITLIENNVIIYDDKTISETFNEFFGNAIKNLKMEPYESVVQEIFALNSSKASPMDSIATQILKENYDIFGFKIFVDFNVSVKYGTFANSQKYADVSPIFKALDRHIKTYFRPSAFYLLYLRL